MCWKPEDEKKEEEEEEESDDDDEDDEARNTVAGIRKVCLDCVRKHLGQATVLLTEAKLGYPTHLWYAVGHLAEAETECVREFPALAKEIREVRLAVIEDKETKVEIGNLIKQATELDGPRN